MIFAFAFQTSERAEAARSFLKAEGCEVDFQHQKDGGAVLAVTPIEVQTPPEIIQAQLQTIVEPFGGESLGYGGIDSHALG